MTTEEFQNLVKKKLIKNKQAIRFYRKLGFKPLSTDLVLDINKRIKL